MNFPTVSMKFRTEILF